MGGVAVKETGMAAAITVAVEATLVPADVVASRVELEVRVARMEQELTATDSAAVAKVGAEKAEADHGAALVAGEKETVSGAVGVVGEEGSAVAATVVAARAVVARVVVAAAVVAAAVVVSEGVAREGGV